MARANADLEATCTVTAKVIRADGTEEDLGVLQVSETDAQRMIGLIEELRPEPGAGPSLEEVNARHEEESARNQAETERINREARGD